MTYTHLRILTALLLPAAVILIWFYCHPAVGSDMYIPMGLLAFACVPGGGVWLSKTAQELDFGNRVTLRGDDDDEPSLFTLNGFGTRFIGVSGNPYVKYQFVCFLFMPVFPIGCYAAKTEDEGYSWYGYAKWSLCEILGIYMKWWGMVAVAGFLIFALSA